MKFKFLSLFLALGIFVAGTSVMAVPGEKQSSSSEKTARTLGDGDWSGAVTAFKDAVINVLAPALNALPTDILTQAPGCKSVYDATAGKVYPQCVVSCAQELGKATSTNPAYKLLIDAASKAAASAETAASTFCAFCVPTACQTTATLANACGLICCPSTSTLSAANACLTSANLAACGTANFPTTCNETTKTKAFLLK